MKNIVGYARKKKLLLIPVFAALILTGCDIYKDNIIDISWLFPSPEKTTVQEPLCKQTTYNIDAVIEEITDRIDTNNIHMKHYVDQEEFEENLAEIIYDDHIKTKNIITLPPGKHEHTLIIQFHQFY